MCLDQKHLFSAHTKKSQTAHRKGGGLTLTVNLTVKYPLFFLTGSPQICFDWPPLNFLSVVILFTLPDNDVNQVNSVNHVNSVNSVNSVSSVQRGATGVCDDISIVFFITIIISIGAAWLAAPAQDLSQESAVTSVPLLLYRFFINHRHHCYCRYHHYT